MIQFGKCVCQYDNEINPQACTDWLLSEDLGAYIKELSAAKVRFSKVRLADLLNLSTKKPEAFVSESVDLICDVKVMMGNLLSSLNQSTTSNDRLRCLFSCHTRLKICNNMRISSTLMEFMLLHEQCGKLCPV